MGGLWFLTDINHGSLNGGLETTEICAKNLGLFLRQEADSYPAPTPTQGKANGGSFSIDRNSKTREEQLMQEAGPCSDHKFLLLRIRRSP